MKKTLIALFLILFSIGAFAQDRFMHNVNPVREDGLNVIERFIRSVSPPVLYSPMAYPGEIPGTSNFWDYQTNGSSLNSIMVFGDTILFCFPAVDSTDPTGTSTRVAKLVITTNGGVNWDAPLPLSTLPNRSGYPELRKVYLTGNVTSVLLSGRKYNGSSSRGGAWVDAFFGLGSFTSANVPEAGRDYFGDLISGGMFGGVFSAQITTSADSLYYCKYNYNTNTMSGRTVLAVSPTNISGNVRYRLASDGGNNLFVMWYDNTTAAYAMRYATSTNAGTSFSSVGSLQTAFGVGGVVNGDTCSPWFGMDATYKPNTTQWHAVWSTLYPTSTGQSSGSNQGCKILFATPTINGGLPVEVAGKINMTIISNTTLFNNRQSLQVGVTPVSHPTIAFSSNGSRIVVAFSAFQPGDSLDSFTYNDIYMTYSDNGGANWITPKNITTTQTWDELYPILSETGNTPTQFTIKYQVTKGPGSQSFTDNAPTYRVYHVMKKFNPLTVGISEIGGNTPSNYSLSQNYPNPFNPTTTIRFAIPKSGFVTLKVYDITGKVIETLVSQQLKAGTKEVIFDASNLPSGVYFYSLVTDGYKETKKMMLIK
jgi:hypothetical protein